ncbi:MAG: ABC transporter permease [Beijerinckiaceae bacterium]|nr:ABC transporter permease [Beijerinckiaceae bacterium]MCZ8301681.1 ABC transporter permease [Beijerinckiaceae bacterium]
MAILARLSRMIMPAIVLFWLAMAFFGHWVAPYDPAGIQDADLFEGMSRKFWLGTDYFGRDMLSRIIAGARYTVGISLMATSLAVTAGVLLGLAASAIGGFFDTAISRFLDALISIPSKMFGLVLVAALGASIPVLVLTLAVIYLPGCYRINRSVAVNVAALDFVAVARARGESTFYIMIREILPNMVGPVLADFGLRFIYVVLLLSSLSFLGLGVQPPEADWGSLVRENMPGLPYGAPAVIMPAIAIASLTIAVNLTIDSAFGRHAREGIR